MGNLSDLTLAEKFLETNRDSLRFCPEWRQWLVWNGSVWEHNVGQLQSLAIEMGLDSRRRIESVIKTAEYAIQGPSTSEHPSSSNQIPSA
jgi:hypothetical protein